MPSKRKFMKVTPEIKLEASFLVFTRMFLPIEAWYKRRRVPKETCRQAVISPLIITIPNEIWASIQAYYNTSAMKFKSYACNKKTWRARLTSMQKLRYVYLEICLAFLAGLLAPCYTVFAESELETTDVAGEQADEEPVTEEDGVLYAVRESEDGHKLANVLIKSYNPGFSDPYIGEFFELVKLPTSSISLAGLSIIYETSSGSEYTVYEFSDGDEMIGESLLMRLASSEEVKNTVESGLTVSDATYTRNMSQSAGRLKLQFEEEVFDSLCWGTKETDCYATFNSKKPTTLVREITEDEIGDFVHEANYAPSFDPAKPGLKHNEPEEEIIEPKCREIEFSEILSYFENDSSEQFIELFNRSEEVADTSGCFIRYKNKNYALSQTIKSRGFVAIYPEENWGATLTKNPTSSNKLELIDTDGETVDSLIYYSGQRRGMSYAMLGYKSDGNEKWEQTYSPTPGEDNTYQQFKTCPVGKVINMNTGNCVTETVVAATLEACPEGKYRNPLTGRCKSYASTASTELKPCAEGYERNPETNRCRKIVENTGADYPLVNGTFEEKTEMTAIFAIITVIVAGIGYIIFQYRDEIKLRFVHN